MKKDNSNRKKRLIILLVILILFIIGGFCYFKTVDNDLGPLPNDGLADVNIDDSNFNIENLDEEIILTLNVGEKINLRSYVGEEETGTFQKVSVLDDTICSIDEEGNVLALADGKTELKFLIGAKEHNASITVETSTSNATGQLVTATNFSNLGNCKSAKVVKTSSGIKMHACITNFSLVDEYKHFQDFAITDDYIYFTSPTLVSGTSTHASQSAINQNRLAALKKISTTYVVGINRKNSTYQVMYLPYSGHGQSFDATNKTLVTSNGTRRDEIYVNAFTYFQVRPDGAFSGGYRGLSYTVFDGASTKSGSAKNPGNSIAIGKNGNFLTKIKTSSYIKNGVFNSTGYYNKVRALGDNGSQYMRAPELAIDEKYNRIAVAPLTQNSGNSSSRVYIYNLSEFRKGNVEKIVDFDIHGSRQGIELYENYLYLWTGGSGKVFHILKYNISTKKLVSNVSFDMINYYKQKGRTENSEAEGISVYNGKIYVGVISRTNVNGSVKNYIDIFMLEGI